MASGRPGCGYRRRRAKPRPQRITVGASKNEVVSSLTGGRTTGSARFRRCPRCKARIPRAQAGHSRPMVRARWFLGRYRPDPAAQARSIGLASGILAHKTARIRADRPRRSAQGTGSRCGTDPNRTRAAACESRPSNLRLHVGARGPRNRRARRTSRHFRTTKSDRHLHGCFAA